MGIKKALRKRAWPFGYRRSHPLLRNHLARFRQVGEAFATLLMMGLFYREIVKVSRKILLMIEKKTSFIELIWNDDGYLKIKESPAIQELNE